MLKPKILVYDLETAPITSYTWGLFDQTIGLNQIKDDWYILAWAAKWLNEPASKTIYRDSRNSKNIQDDKKLVQELSELINLADGVITQNGEKFDIKKLSARAVINKLPPIKSCNSTDILKEGRKVFKFTSHKLEYVSEKLNTKYKKLKHEEYPGFELWKAILAGDKHAWKVMEKYTVHDVLATEESYNKIQGWIKTQNLSVYDDTILIKCNCGSKQLIKQGYAYTDSGKYQIYQCKNCGKWPRSRVNLLSKEKKQSLLKNGRL